MIWAEGPQRSPVGLQAEEDQYRAIGYGIHLKPAQYLFEVTIELGEDVGHPTVITKTWSVFIEEEGALRVVE